MKAWEALVEARIRDWQERKAKGEERVAQHASFESLESQLFDEIVEYLHRAEKSDPVESGELARQAEQLRIRLAIILEKNGLPLIARQLDERIREALTGAKSKAR